MSIKVQHIDQRNIWFITLHKKGLGYYDTNSKKEARVHNTKYSTMIYE